MNIDGLVAVAQRVSFAPFIAVLNDLADTGARFSGIEK